VRFSWTWNKKTGYQPNKPSSTFSHNTEMKNFVERFLNPENQMSDAMFGLEVESVTKVTGATLGFINPERAGMNFKDAEYEKIKQELQQKIRESLMILQENYSKDKNIPRRLKNVQRYFAEEAFVDCFDEINDVGFRLEEVEKNELKSNLQNLKNHLEASDGDMQE
jgi:hypothetical protein